MSKKLNFEFTDDEGNKYKFSVLGNVNKDKILKFLEMTDLLDQSSNNEKNFNNINTTFGKLFSLLDNKFNFGNFTSSDVLLAYEDEYNELIKLSTVSTYLQRFYDKNYLTRKKTSMGWNYKKIQNSSLLKSDNKSLIGLVPK